MEAVEQTERTPKWIWVLVLAMAAIEPAVYWWVEHFPIEGHVFSGTKTIDTPVYLHCMRMFESGFFSPWATCRSDAGLQSVTYFPVPFFWLYGLVGAAGRLVHLGEFITLGLTNGFGAALYLVATWRLLRQMAPKYANRAFLIFAMAGGLGGILYILTALAGFHGHPNFEAYFLRYALYELIEGSAQLFPPLLFPRLYHTVPLALCYFGLAAFLKAVQTDGSRKGLFVASSILLLLGGFLNLRFGPMIWAIAILYLLCRPGTPLRACAVYAALLAIPVALSVLLGSLMLKMDPASGTFDPQPLAMWLSPFLSLVFWRLFIVPGAIGRAIRGLPMPVRLAACAASGYLTVFAGLYVVWHLYYGTFLECGDFSASLKVSDWALLGVIPGLILGSKLKPIAHDNAETNLGWCALWFLLFFAAAISSFAHGRYLLLTPQRIMVFLGPPLSVLTAAGLAHLEARRPLVARGLLATMLSCGLCSTLVAALCFEGPLGYTPKKSPYAWLHFEAMPNEDVQCLEALGDGVVLTPHRFADILTLRGNNTSIEGAGASSMSHIPPGELSRAKTAFFNPNTSDEERQAIARRWCIDWVYCDTVMPPDPATIEQLRDCSWLSEVKSVGPAILFKVDLDTSTGLPV